MKKIIKYFHLDKLGFFEVFIALYPILMGYGYGDFQLSFGTLIIVDVLLIYKRKGSYLYFKPIVLLLLFVVVHELLWLFVMSNVPSYFINSLIAYVIFLISILIIAPALDYKKIEGSINLIAIICIIGMVYHILLVQVGHSVSPIKLPFLPNMSNQSRLYSIIERPTSFFWEPQSYASFMLVPLFFALRSNKIIWAFVIALTVFLSTSTTGIVLVVVMFTIHLFTQKGRLINKTIIVLLLIFLLFILARSYVASSSLYKIENTNLKETNRIINGFLIVKHMQIKDWVLGVPFPNIQDCYDAGYVNAPLIIHSDGVVFVSAFWIALIRFGFLGLLLFLNVYLKILVLDRTLIPYIACVFIALFSNPDFVGGSFSFQMIIMLSLIYKKREYM